ncbi:MAG: FtsB family cell division protein [Streptosporangiaceae bacterium]
MSDRDRRGPRLTGRVGILAIVLCAVALSLAYPVREYIAQRQRISELGTENHRLSQHISALEARKHQLADPVYTRREARERLHFVMPGEKSYVVIDGRDRARQRAHDSGVADAEGRPWFVNLWRSIERADDGAQ